MKEIQSRANPLFRELMHQFRDAGKPSHSIWLEGPHLCEMWLANGGSPNWLVFTESSANDPEVAQLRRRVHAANQLCLNDTLFKAICSVPSHQGVLIVAQPQTADRPIDLSHASVLLDRIQDPGNVGTILRTCAAAGITQVICSVGTAACWTPKVLRSAQGAHFVLRINESEDLISLLQQARAQTSRLPILATALKNAQSLYDNLLPKQAIWLFGHEGQGVADELLALADQRVRIDHAQAAIESLNVASAVAICLFEQWRQHR